jgi:pyruvate dehydrogenase (quinone)
MPGQITTEQAVQLAKALLRGDQNRFSIIKTLVGDKIREVV